MKKLSLCSLLGCCLFLLLGWSACRSRHNVADGRHYYEKFSQTVQLRSVDIPLNEDSVLLRYPFRVRVNREKTRAVILDYHHDSCFYHLFTYPDFRYLCSFGKRGQGPEETLSGDDIRWDDSLIWTVDANRREWQVFRPQGRGVELVRQIDLTATLRPLNFVLADDSLAYIPDYSGRSRLLCVNCRGEITATMGHIPTSETHISSEAALSQAWRGFLSFNPRNGVLAVATQLGEVLEIYHPADSLNPIVVQGPAGEPSFQNVDGYAVPDGIMGFSDVQVGDSCIYAIFQGQSFDEIGHILSEGRVQNDGGRFIYVFSLSGEPICNYELDCKVSGFYVDEVRRQIVATRVNSDRQVVSFELPVKGNE